MNDTPVVSPADETKLCPYCAETIKAAAVVCRYCGRDLTATVTPVASQAQFQPGPRYAPPAQAEQPKRKGNKFLPVLVVLGLAFLGMFLCTRGGTVSTSASRAVVATAAPTVMATLPEATPLPLLAVTDATPAGPPLATATVAPTATPVPTATPKPKIVALVPGTQPADIKVNLRDRQFECSNADQGVKYLNWHCELDESGALLVVDYYSRSLAGIDYINALITYDRPSELQGSFLGYMATMVMACEMDERMAARAWVEKTVPTLTGPGDVRQAKFCGVDYGLMGTPASPVLEMGRLE